MLKVLFAASEGVPFAQTGGLADVIGSLPKELLKLGVDVRIIMPKYGIIPSVYKDQFQKLATFTVPLAWRKQYGGLEKYEYAGLTFYFIDNEYYFKRGGLYGYGDEGERYAYFSRAVLEALPHLDFKPDILHCHDWQTALICFFLKTLYHNIPFYQNLKTLFTIHNLKYQGVCPKVVLTDILGVGWEYFTKDSLEFYDQVNFLKGGLGYADLITTVSKTYAEEIKTAYYGEQLDGLLRQKSDKLTGIINGIDYTNFDPAMDENLSVPYSWQNCTLKQQNKKFLQEKLNLPVRDVPLIAIIARLVSQKGLDLIACVLNEILAQDVQLVILGTGEYKYEELFRWAAQHYPSKVSAQITFNNSLARQIYAGSDLFLMPSLFEPCGLGQMIALRYGSLPIVRETGGLKDTVRPFNEFTGEGNGFSFTNYNAHDMLYTIERALSFYYNKDLWCQLVQNAMQTDCSWQRPAQEYLKLYNLATLA
ncbi:glycogen synthase GlgA [Bacillota bacterium LX-D]|nr:glycogen synthase GlgA [Bacillota bacterium LX-D]